MYFNISSKESFVIIIDITNLFTLLERELVFTTSLEVVESDEELRISIIILDSNEKILPGGPSDTGTFQRMEESQTCQS